MDTRAKSTSELADRIEVYLKGGFYRPGDRLPDSLRGSIGDAICNHLPMVLAALRQSSRLSYEDGQRDMQARAASLFQGKASAIDPFNSAGTRGEIMKPTYEECAAAILLLQIG